MEEEKSQILLWTVPECPYRVTVPAHLINEIRILAVEAFYSVPRGGVEIGGIFFGFREPDTLHIRAYRPIACQYTTGPSFTLTADDRYALSALLEKSAGDPELQEMKPLGWYHSHTRSEVFLSPADLHIHDQFFPAKWQIAMVLRPANLQPARAGFFFRDRSGAIQSDAPVEEIRLEPPRFGMEPIESDVPYVIPKAAPPASASRPRALQSPDLPFPAVPSGETPASEHPAAPTILEVLPGTAFTFAATPAENGHAPGLAVAPLPESGPLHSASSDSGAATLPAGLLPAPKTVPLPVPSPVEVQLPGFLATPKPGILRRNRWIWAAAIVLLCGAGGAAVLNWDRFSRPVDPGLGLETYDINGSFLIRWDRDSPAIRSASRATIEILDGGEISAPIELSPAERLTGGYGYIRRTEQVSVHMKLEGPLPLEEDSNFTASQALGSQPPPKPDPASSLAQALAEKEHLKTELINESMQSVALRREIASLRRQLADERAKGKAAPRTR